MRFSIVLFLLFIAKLSHSQQFQPALSIDTTGEATICFPKDSSWSVNIEQYRWNKWVFIRRLEVQREIDTCFKIQLELHSGDNRFRVHRLKNGIPQYVCCESSVTQRSLVQPFTTIEQYGQGDTIRLPRVSMWEIYDWYGNLIRKGTSQEIPVRGLSGGYYLNYDNVTVHIAVFSEEHRRK